MQTGRDVTEANTLINEYLEYAASHKDRMFAKYLLAVMYVESSFRPEVTSSANAVGLMQMTQVALNDVIISQGLPAVPLERLYDPHLNVKYGSHFLRDMHQKAGGNWTKTLILYNGGFRQLAAYERGESIASETANYVLKVNRAVNICRQ